MLHNKKVVRLVDTSGRFVPTKNANAKYSELLFPFIMERLSIAYNFSMSMLSPSGDRGNSASLQFGNTYVGEQAYVQKTALYEAQYRGSG